LPRGKSYEFFFMEKSDHIKIFLDPAVGLLLSFIGVALLHCIPILSFYRSVGEEHEGNEDQRRQRSLTATAKFLKAVQIIELLLRSLRFPSFLTSAPIKFSPIKKALHPDSYRDGALLIILLLQSQNHTNHKNHSSTSSALSPP
jgi:hypothetical protein